MAGCTIVGHEKVAGWPELEIREHYVAHSVMRDRCAKYVGFGMSPEACAEFNLAAGTCDIWHSADFPPGPATIEHERLHCRGYDHIGGNVLKRALAAWNEYLASRAAQAAQADVDAQAALASQAAQASLAGQAALTGAALNEALAAP